MHAQDTQKQRGPESDEGLYLVESDVLEKLVEAILESDKVLQVDGSRHAPVFSQERGQKRNRLVPNLIPPAHDKQTRVCAESESHTRIGETIRS